MRGNDVKQPLGVGGKGVEDVEYYDEISDIHLTHLYCTNPDYVEKYDNKIKKYAEYLKERGKPLIVSECCWGSFDDAKRTTLIKLSLDLFTKYNAGYVVHALQYSGCADLHDLGDGRTTPDIGNLCFVNKDGSLRPGHDVFNDY